jgi:hypothetical protein
MLTWGEQRFLVHPFVGFLTDLVFPFTDSVSLTKRIVSFLRFDCDGQEEDDQVDWSGRCTLWSLLIPRLY